MTSPPATGPARAAAVLAALLPTAAAAATEAPPIAPDAAEVGIVLLGDGGSGAPAQYEVARAIAAWCAQARCDVVALLGDNFYPAGVRSVRDPQWQTKFEVPYAALALPFRPVVGNHDTYGNVGAQLRYSSDRWLFPAREYAYEVGEGVARVHVVDTNRPRKTHMAALAEDLAASTATWDVVVGHHPVASGGVHGTRRRVVNRLTPVLAAADMYVCGHEHHLEVLRRPDGPVLAISGGAGASLREVTPTPDTVFAASTHGFTYLRLSPAAGTLTVVGADGAVLYTLELPAPAPPSRSDLPGAP